MATFQKRGNKWYYTITVGYDPITGKRIQKQKVGGTTKKEAQAKAVEAEHELNHGKYVEESSISFRSHAFSWLDYYATGSVKKGTVRVREKEIKLFLKYFDQIPIKDITRKMYSDALLDMLKQGYADNTIAGAHGTGKMIFKRAMELELLKKDPTEYARAPKSAATVEEIENKDELPKFMEKEELDAFLKAAQHYGLPGDYEMFLLLAYSGMRVGEMVVLKDTDIVDGKISITKTYYNPTNNAVKYMLEPPKTKTSIREVEIEPIVVKALERYMNKVKEFKMKHRDVYYDKGYIFPNTNKHPGYPNFVKTVQNRMTRLLRIAGLNESLTPHSLRHTHTSLLASLGIPIEDIMDRLGHKDDEVTRTVYRHVTKERKKEASQKFGELMQNL